LSFPVRGVLFGVEALKFGVWGLGLGCRPSEALLTGNGSCCSKHSTEHELMLPCCPCHLAFRVQQGLGFKVWDLGSRV
jgi:hypothetical protein